MVANGKAGIVTLAFDELTRVKLCKPGPESTGSTVTEPAPDVMDAKAEELPGNTSVTVSTGVQGPPGVGVGVGGIGVGVGVGVGVGGTGVGVGVGGTGVGVGVGGTGVGVGVGGIGVGVGAGPATHCARIRTAFCRDEARRVRSTGWAGFGIVKAAVTGSYVPGENAGIATFALVELTTV